MKPDVKIKHNMKGLKQFDKALRDGAYVKLGLLQDKPGPGGKKGSDPHAGSTLTNAAIGVVHEFGRKDNKRPHARSFLRMPVEHESKNIIDSLVKIKSKILADFSKGNKDALLEKLGLAAEKAVIDAFDSQGFGQWEPLRPQTIRRRKNQSDKPLVDTGELKGAVVSVVVRNAAKA